MFKQLPYSLLIARSHAMTSNSKAAQGLLVYLEVNSICTAIPISLSQSSRQLLYRYIIHARPYLVAKVFCYLWTLIDKAAINRGILQNQAFIIKIQLRNSVNQPASGRHHTLYFEFYLNAACFVLIKQSDNTILCFLIAT